MASYQSRWNHLYPKTPPPAEQEIQDLINKGYVTYDPATDRYSLTKEGWAAIDAGDE